MNKGIKNYIKYFLRRNRRILVLQFIILFMLLPFTVYNIAGDMESQINSNIAVLLMLCSAFLACITPLYNYRFIFKRQSCDMYFALPIKKGQLFTIQYILGAVLALIPLCINFIIILLLRFAFPYINVLLLLRYFAGLLLLFLTMYSLISFLVMKCNNLLDSIVVAGGWMFIPLMIIIMLMTYINGQINQFYVSTLSVNSEIFNANIIFSMLSLPLTMFMHLSKVMFSENVMEPILYVLILLYWCVIGCLSYYFARRTFILRKEEDAEQRTTSVLTYPMIIGSTTLSLILLIFASSPWSMDILTQSIIIFVLYIVMLFFAKRKIKLHWKEILIFVMMYAAVWMFSATFQATKGFGLLHEVPDINNIQNVEVFVNVHTYSGEETQSENYEKKFNTKDEIQSVIKVQEEIIQKGMKFNDRNYDDSIYEGNISMVYKMKNGDYIQRYYSLFQTEDENFLNEIEQIILE